MLAVEFLGQDLCFIDNHRLETIFTHLFIFMPEGFVRTNPYQVLIQAGLTLPLLKFQPSHFASCQKLHPVQDLALHCDDQNLIIAFRLVQSLASPHNILYKDVSNVGVPLHKVRVNQELSFYFAVRESVSTYHLVDSCRNLFNTKGTVYLTQVLRQFRDIGEWDLEFATPVVPSALVFLNQNMFTLILSSMQLIENPNTFFMERRQVSAPFCSKLIYFFITNYLINYTHNT